MKVPGSRHMFVFSEVVMVIPFPDNFKMPTIALNNGKRDLIAHVEVFYASMDFDRF